MNADTFPTHGNMLVAGHVITSTYIYVHMHDWSAIMQSQMSSPDQTLAEILVKPVFYYKSLKTESSPSEDFI